MRQIFISLLLVKMQNKKENKLHLHLHKQDQYLSSGNNVIRHIIFNLPSTSDVHEPQFHLNLKKT